MERTGGDGGTGRSWGVAILVGLVLAAALLLVPRALVFEPAAEDACEERGATYVGLNSDSGRYGDPVPEGARCLSPGESSPIEIPVDFFAGSGALDTLLAWVYRLACVLVPIGTALLLGFRLAGGRGGNLRSANV